MQLVVVIAVSAADSAAMTTRTMTSHTFFFSFIALILKFTIFNFLVVTFGVIEITLGLFEITLGLSGILRGSFSNPFAKLQHAAMAFPHYWTLWDKIPHYWTLLDIIHRRC